MRFCFDESYERCLIEKVHQFDRDISLMILHGCNVDGRLKKSL